MASYECDPLAIAAAEQCRAQANTVFLEHPKADSVLRPVSRNAGRLVSPKICTPVSISLVVTSFDAWKASSKTCVPGHGVPWLEEFTERQHAVSHAEGI